MRLIGTLLLVIGLALAITGTVAYQSQRSAAEDQIVGTSDYAGPKPIAPVAGVLIAAAGAGVLVYSRRGRAAAHGPF